MFVLGTHKEIDTFVKTVFEFLTLCSKLALTGVYIHRISFIKYITIKINSG